MAPEAREQRSRFVAELKEFVRHPSVSAQPARAGAVRACAGWLAGHLRAVGLQDVSVEATAGHPIVVGSWRNAPGRPTVLVYGHYDVQPEEPLGPWRSPPFEPAVRGDDLFGRGACDDKGQLFVHVKAIETLLKRTGRLPVNVVCLFEGEEEIGSPHLAPFLTRHRRRLAADAAVISDMPIPAPDRPALTYAMRGGLSLELQVDGPSRDLHSGIFGGAVHNPLQVVCDLVSGLHDRSGRVAVAGFYDRVRSWDAAERRYMASVGPSDREILRDAGADLPWGEAGYTLYERTTIRPALTVNGITGGYQGPGGKAVIPARAAAKISLRLVPDQDPDEIEELVREHVERSTPTTARSEVRTVFKARPALVRRRHPAIQAARAAYRRGFGRDPVFLRSGGTIPVVSTLADGLGLPVVLMGFALPDDRMHAPNEKFHLPNFFNGIETSMAFLSEMARAVRPARRSQGAAVP